jgi:hypothetical protein
MHIAVSREALPCIFNSVAYTPNTYQPGNSATKKRFNPVKKYVTKGLYK